MRALCCAPSNQGGRLESIFGEGKTLESIRLSFISERTVCGKIQYDNANYLIQGRVASLKSTIERVKSLLNEAVEQAALEAAGLRIMLLNISLHFFDLRTGLPHKPVNHWRGRWATLVKDYTKNIEDTTAAYEKDLKLLEMMKKCVRDKIDANGISRVHN